MIKLIIGILLKLNSLQANTLCKVEVCNKIKRFNLDLFPHIKDKYRRIVQ